MFRSEGLALAPWTVVGTGLISASINKSDGEKIAAKSTDVTSPDPTINGGGLTVVEGQANPMRRDTLQVPTMGNTFSRIRADNPGACFFHWLAVTFLEEPLLSQQNTPIPSYVPPQCEALSLPSCGNAAGHVSTTDLSGLSVGSFLQVLWWRPREIGAMVGCVLTVVQRMASVAWYAMEGGISEEREREARERLGRKEARRGKVIGVVKGPVGR